MQKIKDVGATYLSGSNVFYKNKLSTAVENLVNAKTILQVFPNPTSESVQLSALEKLEEVEIRLTDIRGLNLRSLRFGSFIGTEISVGEMPSGLCLLTVYSKEKPIGHAKLIIE